MRSCCLTPPSVNHSMMDGPTKTEAKTPSTAASKAPQDIALLKFFLLLQVTGERKAEIEKLLHGAVGLKPHKDSKAASEDHSHHSHEHLQKQLSPSAEQHQ
ncbi:hypothetical protein SK128_019650 [Halocaridina rubra]|uniref:Uncharacterized protein n=1 Tax=Halocaridina rubra TaxID=373956 RepID=A0AAN8X0F3_HALRR